MKKIKDLSKLEIGSIIVIEEDTKKQQIVIITNIIVENEIKQFHYFPSTFSYDAGEDCNTISQREVDGEHVFVRRIICE